MIPDPPSPACPAGPPPARGRASRHRWTLLVVGLVSAPVPALAQNPPTRADSLEAEVARLRARLDSLAQIVARLTPAQRDTAQVVDELAALRAAARVSAGTDTTRPRSDSVQAPAQDRGGNLNRLNPEISATGDIRFQTDPDAPTSDNVDIREFEFSFQSALDPYAKTKIFLSAGEEGVNVEEGYAYWTGLPGGLRLDLGRFRQQVGELNRWHPHALPESELPLVLREYFGAEGLRGDGVDVTALMLQGATVATLLAQAERLEADLVVLGSHGHRPIYDLLIGSVAEGVVRAGKLPVLLVPAQRATQVSGT